MGVIIPCFHAVGIRLLLIERLNRNMSCSLRASKAAIYSLELILMQPEGLEALSSLIISRTALYGISGSKCSCRTWGVQVKGSDDGGILQSKSSPIVLKKSFIITGASSGLHNSPVKGSVTIEMLHSALLGSNCFTLAQNLAEQVVHKLGYNMLWIHKLASNGLILGHKAYNKYRENSKIAIKIHRYSISTGKGS